MHSAVVFIVVAACVPGEAWAADAATEQPAVRSTSRPAIVAPSLSETARVALVAPIAAIVGTGVGAAVAYLPNGGLGVQLTAGLLVDDAVNADPTMSPGEKRAIAMLSEMTFVLPVALCAGAAAMIAAAVLEQATGDDADPRAPVLRHVWVGIATAMASAVGLTAASYFFGALQGALGGDATAAWVVGVGASALLAATTAAVVGGIETELGGPADDDDDGATTARMAGASLVAVPATIAGGALGAVVGGYAVMMPALIVSIPLAIFVGPEAALFVAVGGVVVAGTLAGSVIGGAAAAAAVALVEGGDTPLLTLVSVGAAALVTPFLVVGLAAGLASDGRDFAEVAPVAMLGLLLPAVVAAVVAPIDVAMMEADDDEAPVGATEHVTHVNERAPP